MPPLIELIRFFYRTTNSSPKPSAPPSHYLATTVGPGKQVIALSSAEDENRMRVEFTKTGF